MQAFANAVTYVPLAERCAQNDHCGGQVNCDENTSPFLIRQSTKTAAQRRSERELQTGELPVRLVLVFGLLGCLALAWAPHEACAKWVWNKETGYVDTSNKAEGKKGPDERYKSALALVTEERYLDALGEFKKLAKKYKKSKVGEKAQFKVAEMLRRVGKTFDAFQAYEKLFKDYPTTTLSQKALKNEFELGKLLAPMDKSKAIEIFQKVVDRDASSPYAAEAEVRTGDCYHEMGKHEDARDVYQRVIAVYSPSEWVSVAQFRAGRCGIELFKSTGNAADLTKAKQDLRGYLSGKPKGDYAKEAAAGIKQIQYLEAEKEFKVAEYYCRQKKPRSAAVYFKLIMKKYPETTWAEKSRARLEELER